MNVCDDHRKTMNPQTANRGSNNMRHSTASHITLHCTTLHYSTLQCTTAHCSTLQCTTVHYSTLNYSAVHYSRSNTDTLTYFRNSINISLVKQQHLYCLHVTLLCGEMDSLSTIFSEELKMCEMND